MNATLVRLQVRRERWLLPIWILGIVALFLAAGAAIAREFGDEAERFAIAALAAGNPAFLFLRGLPDGDSVGALTFFQAFNFLAILVGLMNTFLIVRHTRTDEDRGRSELLLPTGLMRTAELRVVLGIAVVANAAAGLIVSVVALLLDFGAASSVLIGTALGSVGLAFAGIAAVFAQIMPSPRGANGAAAAAVGIAYVVRGIGDALGTAVEPTRVEPSWVSSLSPIGWAQATAPFSTATPLPLIGLVVLAGVTFGVAFALRARRDLGAAVVPERVGPTRWRRASAGALARRMQRPSLIGWTIGVVVLGSIAGSLAPVVADAVASNDSLNDLIGSLVPGDRTDTQSLFTLALLGMAGALASAAGIVAVLRLHSDESEGRAEELITTRLRRLPWLMRQLGVAVVSVIVVAIAAATAAGVGLVASGTDWDAFVDTYPTVGAHLPAGLVFVAIATLAVAAAPRFAVAISWGAFVLGIAIGQLGDLIGLPEWLQDISPYHHVPAYPLEEITLGSVAIPIVAAAALVGAGAVVFAWRDVVPRS